MNHRAKIWTWGLVVMLAAIPTQAKNLFSDAQISARPGGERFRWKDFNQNGDTVAEESGTRAIITVSVNNHYRRTTGFIFGADLETAQGTVDYNGDAWTGVQVPPSQAAITNAETKSDRASSGMNGGVRYVAGYFGFNLLGGFRYETWSREIKNGIATTGAATYGHNESYDVGHFRASGGIDFALERFQIGVLTGVMSPTSATHKITLDVPTSDDEFSVDLKFKQAYFAALNSSIALGKKGRHLAAFGVYWNSYKTKPSTSVFVSARGTAYAQPGIDASSLGFVAGYGYKF